MKPKCPKPYAETLQARVDAIAAKARRKQPRPQWQPAVYPRTGRKDP